MTGYKSVCIAGGSGGLGFLVTKQFLKSGEFKVSVISRKNSNNKTTINEIKKLGGTVNEVDILNVENLKQALNGVDVVICTYGAAAIHKEQLALIEAAKAAKVKRFIPSEFGVDIEHHESVDFVKPKKQIMEAVKASGLEYTLVPCGFFPETTFTEVFGFHINQGQVEIIGEGNAKISWTHREDVGRYLVQIVKHCDKTVNKVIRVEGDRGTFNEVVKLMEEKKNKKFTVKHLPLEEAKKKNQTLKNPMDVAVNQLRIIAEEGKVLLKTNDNNLFSEVKPLKLKDVIAQL